MRAVQLTCAAAFAGVALSVATASTGAGPDWADTGLKRAAGKAPYGVGVRALVEARGRLYAATNVGLFRSDSRGSSWFSVQPKGLATNVAAQELAVYPSNPDRVWAAMWSLGVYRSVDGGRTWAASNPGDHCSAVAVDPTNPLVVYAGCRLRGIYRSTDGGATWGAPATGVTSDNTGAFPTFDPSAIFVHPKIPSIVLAGIDGTGIFRSTDGGRTFAKAMTGINTTPYRELGAATLKRVGEFVYDPVTRHVLVGMSTAVYRSASDGASWSPSSKGIPYRGSGGDATIRQSPWPGSKLIVYGAVASDGGLLGSKDSGRTWQPLSTSGLPRSSSGRFDGVAVAAFDRREPTTIYLGTMSSGVYKTANGAGILGQSPTTTTTATTAKTPAWCRASAAPAGGQPIRVVYIGNAGVAENGPTAASTFTTTKTWHVVEVTTFHWNRGLGARPGRIGITDLATGRTCVWNAVGRAAGGAPNAYWVASVSFDLPPGRYQFFDSDPVTWSHNVGTGGRGMAWIMASGTKPTTTTSTTSTTSTTTKPTTTSAAPPRDAWATTATSLRGRLYAKATLFCPANGNLGKIWGSGIYTDDSSICTAAVHAGAIRHERGGTVKIEIREGQKSYEGSLRRGVVSYSRGPWPGSFVIIVT